MADEKKVETEGPTREMAVAHAFTLTRDDGTKVQYGVGTHKRVPVSDAEHYYTQFHLVKDGDEPPRTETGPTDAAQDRAARAAAEGDAQRLRVVADKATEEAAAAKVEIEQLRGKLSEVEAERDALRGQLDAQANEGEEDEPSTDDVRVHRKGRRWFVHKGDALAGEYGSKDAADAKAAELRAGG